MNPFRLKRELREVKHEVEAQVHELHLLRGRLNRWRREFDDDIRRPGFIDDVRERLRDDADGTSGADALLQR